MREKTRRTAGHMRQITQGKEASPFAVQGATPVKAGSCRMAEGPKTDRSFGKFLGEC
jgi:hypothetical protein